MELCRFIDEANQIQMWQELSKKGNDKNKVFPTVDTTSDVTDSPRHMSEDVDEDAVKRSTLLKESSQFIFDQMFKKALVDLMPIIEASKAFLASSSVRQPPQWYPYARMQKRKIIYHGGPTNSGKVSIILILSVLT